MAKREGSGRRNRTLAAGERALWEQVARTTTPIAPQKKSGREPANLTNEDLNGGGLESADTPVPDLPPKRPAFVPDETLRLLRPSASKPSGSKISLHLLDDEIGPVGRPEAGLDRRTSDRLRRGNREPDARIDLHGMTAERAHRACLQFLATELGRGSRVVLVITGKGGRGGSSNSGTRCKGVLKAALPGWLRASPLGHSIVGIYEANPRHGGGGAFYVYLKRQR